MKNNEIMISARFESPSLHDEISFLMQKDMSLRVFMESVYYGLKKKIKTEKKYEPHFQLLEEYLKSRKELQVLYGSKAEFRVIDFTEDGILERKLDELGMVTSSCALFTLELNVTRRELFQKNDSSYILRSGDSLEYNISTRRLNVIEPSVVEILPPGEMPQKSKASLVDVLVPTLLSTGGMLAARFLVMRFSRSASGMGDTMLLMSGAMGIVALVTSLYNFMKQKREYGRNVQEWKEGYETYIKKKIATIKEWQKSDINYLNSVYPDMNTLFENTAKIHDSIFSRAQNDRDFMRISLGTSDEVKPLFEIKSEKKDTVFNDIYYKKTGDEIKILIPSRKEEKRIQRLTTEEQAEERKNNYLLTDLAYTFANKGVDPQDSNEIIGFNYLRSDEGIKPPLLLDLQSCGALGVISNDALTSANFIRHMVFELAYYHSPEDIQFVFFFEQEDDVAKQNEVLRDYKYLPHANELLDGVSQFVFDKDSSGIVFGQLLSIMNGRTKTKKEDADEEEQGHTQIVCIVFYDYDIKETGFSKFLPEVPREGEPYVNSNGLTFVFVQSVKDKLPKYCGNIVNIDRDNPNDRRSSLRYNVLSREMLNVLSGGEGDASKAGDTDKLIEYKHFQNNFIFNGHADDEKFHKAFRQLSAIYYTRVAENGKVPSMVTLFELFGYDSEKIENGQVRREILDNWKDVDKNDITQNLCVPIGMNEHGAMYLDLYEKADGPHMLVAGTTGSGKSESIITYLIGLCMKFSPMDLNLMLVDMKGGGFSDRLGGLPHCVGVVTDTAGEEEGTSAAYMLKRFLESLNAEIKKRKLLLSSLGVDNVDAYIRSLRVIRRIKEMEEKPDKRAEISRLKEDLNEKQLAALDKDLSEFRPLSHLVLVVDEFTELKRFSNESDDTDFIAEITTIARVGRTLGFHIILVSQNIEGAITDDIRVNSKARLCLKVATKQASKEMIDSPAAAAPTMPLNGRAYLLVGTGSRFEYFQSAYTGANRNLNIEPPTTVTRVPNSGRFDAEFYLSQKDNEREKNKKGKAYDTQLAYITNTIIEMSRSMEKPVPVFLEPLPGRIYDETEWEGVG